MKERNAYIFGNGDLRGGVLLVAAVVAEVAAASSHATSTAEVSSSEATTTATNSAAAAATEGTARWTTEARSRSGATEIIEWCSGASRRAAAT